jgi:hypothetical protein
VFVTLCCSYNLLEENICGERFREQNCREIDALLGAA